MAECIIDRAKLRNSVIEAVKGMAIESGTFVEENSLLTPVDPTSTSITSLIEEINSLFQDDVISPSQEQEGAFEVIPSEELIDAYEAKYADEITAQEQVTERTGDKPKLSPSNQRVVDTILNFLDEVGVQVEEVNNIQIEGETLGVEGVAFPLKSLIQHVTGSENTVLTEEAMHIAVELLSQRNKPLFNSLIQSVTKFPIYKQTLAELRSSPQYKNPNGSVNINKIKKEAVGKLLTQAVVNRQNIPEARTFWSKIKQFLKNLFSPLSSQFERYRQAVDTIFQSDMGTIRNTLLQSEQYLRENGVLEEDIPRIISLAQSDLTDAELRVAIQDFVPNMAYFKTSASVEARVKNLISSLSQVTEQGGVVSFKGKVVPNSDINIALRRLKTKLSSTNPLFQTFENLLKDNQNSENHKNLKEILGKLIDKDGYLVSQPVDFSNESAEYQELARSVSDKLASFPDGTKFLTDILIADDRASARVDILAIDPTETFHILNYQDVNLKADETIDSALSFALQGKVQTARDILERGYRVNKFGQSRTLLINENPASKSLETTAIDTEYWHYLAPIPTESETMGSEQIDRIYKSMYNIHSRNKTVGAVKTLREVLNNRTLTGILRSFRAVQISRNLRPITNQINELKSRMEEVIKTYNSEIKDKNLPYNSQKVTNLLKDVALYLEIYDSMSKMASAASTVNQVNEIFSKDSLKALRTASHKLDPVFSELLSIGQEVTDSFIAKPRGIRGVLLPELVQMYLDRNFRTTSTSTQATVATLHKLISHAQGEAELSHSENIERIKKIKDNYTKWAKARNLPKKSLFDIITQKTKDGKYIHRLVDKIDKTFFDQAKEALQNKDINWVKNNINLQSYNTWFEEAKQLEFDRIELMSWSDPSIDEEAMREEMRENWLDRYDLQRGLNSSNTAIYRFPQEDKFLSDGYKQLLKKGNEPALELYNFIQDLNKKAVESGVLDEYVARTFLPFREKGAVETMLTGGRSITKSLTDKFKDQEGYIVYGDWSPHEENLRRIPFNLIYDISKRTFNEQTGEVEQDYSNVSTDIFSLLSAYDFEIEKYKRLSEIESSAYLLRAVEANKASLATSKTGGPEEGGGTVDNVINLDVLDKQIAANIYGVRQDKFDLDGKFTIPLNTASKAINNILGKKVLREDRDEMHISVRKALEATRNIVVFRALGAAVSPAIVNFFGTNIQAANNAGKYYTYKEAVANATLLYNKKLLSKVGRKEQTIDIALLDYFNILVDNEGNVSKERSLHLSQLQKIDPERDMFFLLRESDKPAQYMIGISYLKNTMVENGELVNIREYLSRQPKYLSRFEGTTEQIKQAKAEFEAEVAELKRTRALNVVAKFNSEGRLEIPGIDRVSSTVVKTREVIQQLAKDATGMGTINEFRLWNAGFLQRNLFTFFSWAPRLLEKRFGSLRQSSATQGDYEWGRIRVTMNALSSWINGTGTSLINYLTLNEKGVAALKEQFQKQVEIYENKTGKQYFERGDSEALNRQLAENDFIEMYTRNLRQQVRELITLGSLFGVLLSALALSPDEDDELTGMHKFFVKVVRKTLSEVSFYYNPMSIADLTSGKVLPGVALIRDFSTITSHIYKEIFGDEQEQEKAKPLGKIMKATPVLSQIAPIMALFQQEIAKQLDYELPDPDNPPNYNR